MTKPVRVRFAPSPTGPLHIGGVRTALYNYLFAKKHGGTFVLRIEDTDQTRFVPGAEEYINEALRWCSILPDEGPGFGGDYGPYRQSERKKIYRQYAEALVKNGFAYYAYDTPEELEQMRQRLKAAKVVTPQYNAITRSSMKNSLTLPEDEVRRRIASGENFVIRLKVPRNEEIRLHDMVRGWVVVHSSNIDDKVLYKSDGMPTYHLANVVDDYLMKTSHVIRGEEWLPSAPLHVLLYRYLGWEADMPAFAHLPLILKPDGNGKLSKRDGDRLGFPVFPLNWTDPETKEFSSGYRERGYFPQAVINMLAFLGWNPGTAKELFSLKELEQEFSLERVGKAGAKFDFEKAKWFNQQYLRMQPDKVLAEKIAPLLKEHSITVSIERILRFCGIMKERAVFPGDMLEGIYLFQRPPVYDEQLLKKKWSTTIADTMEGLTSVLRNVQDFSPLVIEQAFKKFVEEKKLKTGNVLPVFRLLVTGKGAGPSMFEIAAFLGKEETVERISETARRFSDSGFQA